MSGKTRQPSKKFTQSSGKMTHYFHGKQSRNSQKFNHKLSKQNQARLTREGTLQVNAERDLNNHSMDWLKDALQHQHLPETVLSQSIVGIAICATLLNTSHKNTSAVKLQRR